MYKSIMDTNIHIRMVVNSNPIGSNLSVGSGMLKSLSVVTGISEGTFHFEGQFSHYNIGYGDIQCKYS